MGIFTKPSENAKKIMDYLDCPCKYFPQGKPLQLIRSAYEDAYAVSEMGGFTPLIICVNDALADMIDDIRGEYHEGETTEQFRHRLLEQTLPAAGEWFTKRLHEIKDAYGSGWEQITQEIGDRGDKMDMLSGFVDFSTKKSRELILAKIPTDKPWEAFAWIPFGGWNECPDTSVMISAARYWYEQFHAVPAVIASDILEFTAFPVRDRSAAIGLALEQYAFCPDIIDFRSLEALADTLTQSTVWYFWWD